MKNILHVVGARPNFMKLSPVYDALKSYSNITQQILHTGQHYSHNMSDIFFEQLNIPKPNTNLEISGNSVLTQIGNGILKLENYLLENRPDLICIYGDINATAFTSIVASKLGIKLAHIESGLRSNDISMPEETNRIIADALSDYFFTPSLDANENLLREGKPSGNIFFVGNVMIDTIVRFLPVIQKTSLSIQLPQKYILLTLHRPSNVDVPTNLAQIINIFKILPNNFSVIFPVHPRTNAILIKNEINIPKNFILLEPLDYFQFIKIQLNASLVITDSGGVQEETTFLQVPCFTFRDNTERPVTISKGTNTLVGASITSLLFHLKEFLAGNSKKGELPELWDGKSGDRIARHLNKILNENMKIVNEEN